jgi:hypothetical protein
MLFYLWQARGRLVSLARPAFLQRLSENSDNTRESEIQDSRHDPEALYETKHFTVLAASSYPENRIAFPRLGLKKVHLIDELPEFYSFLGNGTRLA